MWPCKTFTEDSHNTGNFMPYSSRIVCGFFNVPWNCEHSRVVRRGLRFIVLIQEDLKVLTICRCNYKGSTFSSVILKPWVLVQPESNSRPPAGQTVAQLTEPPVRCGNSPYFTLAVIGNWIQRWLDWPGFWLELDTRQVQNSLRCQ